VSRVISENNPPAVDEATEKLLKVEVDRRREDGVRQRRGWVGDPMSNGCCRYESVYHLVKLLKRTVFRVHMAEYWLGPDALILPLRKADDGDE